MSTDVSVKTNLKPLVICGPSGVGKSTLIKRLLVEFPNSFGFSVSHTTRQTRPGETDGVHYHFTNKTDMQASIDRGEFIESATFSGNLYGTSKASVNNVLAQGKVCILDIEIQGVKQVRKSDLEPYFVFIKPPSINDLENRLRTRKTETEESLAQRLNVAKQEIAYGETPGNFDLVIVNEDVNHAYNELRKFAKKVYLPPRLKIVKLGVR